MASDGLARTLELLVAEREQLREKLTKLDAAIDAIEALLPGGHERPSDSSSHPRLITSLPVYSGMKLADAAAMELRRSGRGMTTRELWNQMYRRGSSSESKDPVNSLYTVLNRDRERFARTDGFWYLHRDNDEELGF